MVMLTRVLCATVLLLIVSDSGLSTPSSQGALPHGSDDEFGITLSIRLTKRVFRSGETIEVLAILENKSAVPRYVGRGIVSLLRRNTSHELVLRIFSSDGEEIPLPRMSAAEGLPRGVARGAAIQNAYQLLYPGTLYGVRTRVPVRLRPGTYRFEVRYAEFLARSLSEEERTALKFSIQTVPVERSVRIRVR
jgi:hypothetical protein